MIADFTKSKKISDKLYGLFFEDINFSVDGGINNNQVINHSFEARSCDYKRNFAYLYYKIFRARRRYMTRIETEKPLLYWNIVGEGDISSVSSSLNKNGGHAAKLTIKGSCRLENLGYNGGDYCGGDDFLKRKNSDKSAIGVKKGNAYTVSFFGKTKGFDGKINIFVENESRLTSIAEFSLEKGDWRRYTAKVRGLESGVGKFVVEFVGKGICLVDEFYFGDNDCYDFGAPYGGKMRKDLVDALAELNPSFMRFPGGCLVEGYSLDNAYDWKETIGPIEKRIPKVNVWGEEQKDKCYMQSYQIGFHEFFLLCEHLKCEPLPILNAGLACQGRSMQTVTDGDEFEKIKSNILDLIEYANGNENTVWGSQRAKNGHPNPFKLKMIGIGNENHGEIYDRNFDLLRQCVKEKYPTVSVVRSNGFWCYKKKPYAECRKHFDTLHPDCICDDHFYNQPSWLTDNCDLYDDYDRKRSRIFLGEYAARPNGKTEEANTFLSALSEAAFLTGVERNADIVVMSSYAPLFCRDGGAQWRHNMIDFNSLSTLKTVNYYVQKLYANNYGSTYVPVDFEPEDVKVSVTADKSFVYVKAVNLAEAEKELNLTFSGCRVEGVSYTVMKGKDDDRNIFIDGEIKETVVPVTVPFKARSVNTLLPPRSVNVFKLKKA